MSFDYDLLVVGNTLAGILTAIRARHYQARVAIVRSDIPDSMLWSALLSRFPGAKIHNFPNPQEHNQFTIADYVTEILGSFKNEYSSASLSILGIDVIEGTGEFCRLPEMGFIVNRRRLRSRSYLLAIAPTPCQVDIPGLQKTGYLTILDCQTPRALDKLSIEVVIIGFHTIALEFAQTLAQLGKNVVLIFSDESIFYRIDPEYLKIILTSLKILGVSLIIGETILQVDYINNKKTLLFVNRIVYSEEIILVSNLSPDLSHLNLESVGVDSKEIEINSKLQTANPCIYSFRFSNGIKLNSSEIEIILKNSLFLPIFDLPDFPDTQIIYTNPSFLQIGYSEKSAREYFDTPIIIGKKDFKSNIKSQISSQHSGFIKLIVKNNLELVGVTIVGDGVEEMMAFFLIFMNGKTHLDNLLKPIYPPLSYSHIIYQAALDAIEKKNKSRLDSCLLSWFIWRKL